MNDNMHVQIDELLSNTLTDGRDPLSELIDEEEDGSETVHEGEDRDPLLKAIEDKAVAYLGRFNEMARAIADTGLPPVKVVATALIAEKIDAVSTLGFLTRFGHQIAKDTMFELYRRQKAEERRQDQARLPTRDRFTQSVQLRAVIAGLPRRISEDSAETPIETASSAELERVVQLRCAEIRTMHSETFRLAYGQYPTQALGYLSVEADGQWLEVEDWDTARTVFDELQEAKAEERKNRDITAAKGIIAAFAAAKA